MPWASTRPPSTATRSTARAAWSSTAVPSWACSDRPVPEYRVPQPTSDAARLLALLDEGASLRGRNFRKTNLACIELEDRDLRGIDLRGANLALARLVRCDLTGANLAGADIHQSVLAELRLANADLRKVN